MPRLTPAWIAARERLHARLDAIQPIRDASQFAYIRGPEERFSEQAVARMWREANTDGVPGALPARSHVYVHVPFCKSICTFCNYERLRASSPGLLADWEARLLRSLRTIAPSVQGLTFYSLYLGGGTPSVLPAPMLDRVLTALGRELNFDPRAGRHIELDPAVVSRARLEVLARHGFRQVSFGIQSLDPAINRAHNRGAQGPDTVTGCFDQLAELKIDQVSCDFLLGLAGTTPAQMISEITAVLAARSALSIDIFTVVPTQGYVRAHFGDDDAAFWAHLARFEAEVLPRLADLGRSHGYALSEATGHCFKLKRVRRRGDPPELRGHSYTQLTSEQQRPLHLLGLGLSARSQIFGRAAFRYQDPLPDDPDRRAWYQGQRMNPERQIRTYLIHQLRDRGTVDRARFVAIFGLDVTASIPEALAAWDAAGLVTVTPERITLAAQSMPDRARALMWLVPIRDLEWEVGRVLCLDLSADGQARLLAGLPAGTALAGRWIAQGMEAGSLVLQAGGHRVRMRLAPPLENGDPLRVVVEDVPPADAGLRRELATAARRLRGLLRRWHGVPRGGRDA